MNSAPYTAPQTLAQQVAQHISDRIVNGELPVDYQIKVLDLASTYSVSQTVAREALQILERSYLVKNIPRKGTFVKGTSYDEIFDVWEIKKRLWSYAFRMFCEKYSENEELIGEFNRIVDGMIRSGTEKSEEELFQYNFELAEFIIRHCKSDQLSTILNSIEVQVKRFRYKSISLGDNIEETVRFSILLKKSVNENQPRLVEKYAEEFIEMDRATLLNNLDKLR